MEALLWQIEGIASCPLHTPEQLRFPFHTSKCSQSTVHNMLMKNMVELCRSPASARFSTLICFIRKTQHILQVLPNPLSQLGGQPTQDQMSSTVNVLKPLWRGCLCIWHGQLGNRMVNKLNPAWLQKVDVQAYMTRAILGISLFFTEQSEYILSCTCSYSVRTNIYMYNMDYYRCTPKHGTLVEHGDQGRVTNPSLEGNVQITISQCNWLYLILVLRHRRRAWMLMDVHTK